jgi:hypothetical protein
MRSLTIILALLLASLSSLRAQEKTAAPSGPMDLAVQSLLGRQYLHDLTNGEANHSIRGVQSLWTQVLVQRASKSPALETLEADLRLSEMEGPLRDAGLEILDAKDQPLSLGSKPTLVLNVYFMPKASQQAPQDFYLVTLRAVQEVRVGALGSLKRSLTTWMKVSEPLPSLGDAGNDAAAIRKAARGAVASFINAVKDQD